MCGILGHFAFSRSDDVPIDELRRQVNALRHRGPDDGAWWQDGPFAFGHRRLSIIDVGHGSQPMASSDGRFVVTFNGEIYNYIELRDELRASGAEFRTESDTEVLLHGYRRWGTSVAMKLKGMFAFAVADRVEQQLYLARDRFGEKPLLVVESSDAVTFASEMRPLTSLAFVDRQLDESALASYLCLNYVPGDETLIKAVRRVPPGSWRIYGREGLLAKNRFWQPIDHATVQHVVTEAEALERLEVLLDDSVRIALRSDVPVGVFLSSGIDSSLIAMSAARSGRLSHAYCLAMPERSYSEWEGAARTARRLGVPISRVSLEPSALRDFLEVVEHADDPLADSSALAMYTLSKAASAQNKVVIGGDGGDELFGGYLTYQATLWHERAISPLPPSIRRALKWCSGTITTRETKVSVSYKLWRFLRAADLPSNVAHFTWNGTWLPDDAAAFMRTDSGKADAQKALRTLAARHGLPQEPTVEQLQRADIADYLPNDILAKGDRMSMAHGLELRSPFLDPGLADFALSLPTSMKTGLTGRGKRILRTLATKAYGATHAYAEKQGFSIPVHAWLRGPARDLMIDLLAAPSVNRIAALDSAAVTRAVRAHLEGHRSYGFELWGLMVLVAWHRKRMAHPLSSDELGEPLRRLEIPCPALIA
jgi:asparagine synthase (glutamine-hydrolysing)